VEVKRAGRHLRFVDVNTVANLRLLRKFYEAVLWYDDNCEAMENASLALSLELLLAAAELQRAYAE
jgi:hypothetical protein